MLVFYGKGNGEVLRASCIAMGTNLTKRLTALITNTEDGCLDVKSNVLDAWYF